MAARRETLPATLQPVAVYETGEALTFLPLDVTADPTAVLLGFAVLDEEQLALSLEIVDAQAEGLDPCRRSPRRSN